MSTAGASGEAWRTRTQAVSAMGAALGDWAAAPMALTDSSAAARTPANRAGRWDVVRKVGLLRKARGRAEAATPSGAGSPGDRDAVSRDHHGAGQTAFRGVHGNGLVSTQRGRSPPTPASPSMVVGLRRLRQPLCAFVAGRR